MSTKEFKQRLSVYAQRAEEALELWLPHSGCGRLPESCRYSTLAGGKRIRASLAQIVGECFQHETSPAIMRFACAIELIHAYSLIHDDLPAMDNDDFRRGKPTNHKVYGEAIAILAGDNLLTTAFAWLAKLVEEKVAPDKVVKLIALVAEAAGENGMIGGQVLDIEAENQKISIGQLETIHLLKTGALLSAPIIGAAMLCDAAESDIKALQQYSKKIGLLFQIVDDLLDVEGDLKELGKAPGSDEKKGKATYPSILGLEKTRSLAASTHSQALD
jgi:geranylgeranyl diphosphate synthase type II